ncbi:MAG: IS21-like element helper ATPase IstB [Defluviitaleaceae bacterium]|nr:IS21-like element helper ATPase IstB [Defluviitaleaceae bacterium]
MSESIKVLSTQLRLPYLKENAHLHLEQARLENKSYEDFLIEILEYEIALKNQNSVKNRIKRAKFPYHKTLDELVIDELPDGAKQQYQSLRSLDFISSHQNIILAGNPGTGKTHISIGLGLKACMAGYNVYFTHVPDLIIRLKEAQNERTLGSLKKRFEKYELIILDELGYISFDKEGAELLFNLISSRTECAATIFTTNLSFDRWDEIFHDKVLTAAIVDRITHHSYVINMNGESYRLKQSTSLKRTI